jgi:ABC-type cobalamin/Fe3+-siderophores transport system ATPase subunit
MIKELHFKAGSSKRQPPLILEDVGPMTVFVGPNNAGKSQALREIFQFCQSGQPHLLKVIFSALPFRHRSEELASLALSRISTEPLNDTSLAGDDLSILLGAATQHVSRRYFLEMLKNPSQSPNAFATQYLQHRIINLDGGQRLSILNPQPIMDVRHPNSSLAKLAIYPDKRITLRNDIRDATGMYAALDATHGQYQMRFSEEEPPDEMKLDSVDLRNYMDEAKPVEAVSDGVKAYSGILLALYASDPEIIFIDEPEAFLHPALSAKLAKSMAAIACSQAKQIFVATHSPHFLMGAIQSGAEINIVRLTYDGETGTARLLPADRLVKLMRDPLLRSVGVIEGLFYNAVIVCEGNSDRAFYQEVNERLVRSDDTRAIPHALFLNAENKQTVSRITKVLRSLGIQCAEILDIDVLKDGGDEWARHLRACGLPEIEHQPYGNRRNSILKCVNDRDKDFKIRGGINLLTGKDREAAENLLSDLAKYGCFVVPKGEVEAWLEYLGIPKSKKNWLPRIFERMGSDPDSVDYVRPSQGDVWDFIGEISKWLRDPHRKGIPV